MLLVTNKSRGHCCVGSTDSLYSFIRCLTFEGESVKEILISREEYSALVAELDELTLSMQPASNDGSHLYSTLYGVPIRIVDNPGSTPGKLVEVPYV